MNRFLVFDLGGGTFDVSIVEMFDGIIEVRASAGDNRLGGEDFNDVLITLAEEKLRVRAGRRRTRELAPRGDARRRGACAARAERADEAPFAIVWDGAARETTLTAAEFEARAQPLIDRLREPVLRSMRDSSIRLESLSEVVLVGGATRMPIVRRAVTRMCGRFPNAALHPDHAVALGAAVQAGLKARDAALDEVRLTDVCPFTLGVDVSERDPSGQLRTACSRRSSNATR